MSTFWPCETATMMDRNTCTCKGEHHFVGTRAEIERQKDVLIYRNFTSEWSREALQHPPKAR